MTIKAPFQGNRGENQIVSANSSSATASISSSNKSVRLVNSGATNIVHVRIHPASDTTAATTADVPVLPNSSIILSKGEGDNKASYISAAGTTLHIQAGEGGTN